MSVNYAFAVEDTTIETSSESDIAEVQTTDIQQDNTLTADDNLNTVGSTDNDILGAETAPVTIKMGKVTKRYNGAIQYRATFYDASGNPLKNQKVYFEVDGSKE